MNRKTRKAEETGPSRREFVAAAALVGLLPASLLGSGEPRGAGETVGLTLPEGDGRAFPILFAGEGLVAGERIRMLVRGQPTFGRSRNDVNPVEPIVRRDRTVMFSRPGEYYLGLNDFPLQKILVLDPSEPLSRSVVRIFDFTAANSVYYGGEDHVWYRDRDRLIDRWLASAEPLLLSCGPSHAVFRRLVEETLGLPVRVVTFPGTWLREGRVQYFTHNVAEVFLPDRNSFVAFDVNHSMLCPWMDALEIADRVRSLTDSSTDPDPARLEFEIRNAVVTLQPRPNLPPRIRTFGESMLSRDVVNPKALLRVAYGGSAYWGRETTWQFPTGTEFLPGHYLYASLHTRSFLREAAVAWIESSNIPVTLIEPDELRCLLAEGHASVVAEQAWLRKPRPHAIVN